LIIFLYRNYHTTVTLTVTVDKLSLRLSQPVFLIYKKCQIKYKISFRYKDIPFCTVWSRIWSHHSGM